MSTQRYWFHSLNSASLHEASVSGESVPCPTGQTCSFQNARAALPLPSPIRSLLTHGAGCLRASLRLRLAGRLRFLLQPRGRPLLRLGGGRTDDFAALAVRLVKSCTRSQCGISMVREKMCWECFVTLAVAFVRGLHDMNDMIV